MPVEALAPTAYADKPEVVAKNFCQPVLEADGLVVVVPEYNGSYPGAVKLWIDLLPFPEAFEERPVSFVGLSAGDSGAVRGVEQLGDVFSYRYAHIFSRRVYIPAVYKHLDSDGQMTNEDLRERLQKQTLAFQQFVRQLKG